MFNKSFILFTALCANGLSLTAIAAPTNPPTRINHDNCAEHLTYLVMGVENSGVGRRSTNKIIRNAQKFDAENSSYTVDERTAAWTNYYNPMVEGGADANWVDGLHGPSHPLNSAFFDGRYATANLRSPEDIKEAVLAMTQSELDSLPSIRKYDIMNGDWHMPATVEQIRYFGLERDPEPRRWEGFCFPFRFLGATCPVPTKNVSRTIPETDKTINFSPYDVATVAAAHYNGTEDYARIGSINRGRRDNEPPNAGTYHIMLQAFKIMKEEYSERPFSAIFDVEPNAELWNEALQNWDSAYGEVTELTAAQIRRWRAPEGSTKFVDVETTVQLSNEGSPTNRLTRSTVARGGGMNTLEYPYRLYLNDDDKIVGGSWLRDQGQSFPDLVGFANGKGIGTESLDHDIVVQLIRDSTDETDRVIPGS